MATTTQTGNTGEYTLSFMNEFTIIRYAIHPDNIIMIALPIKMRIDPIPETIVKRPELRTKSQNVSQHA
jgi:hypothetical protein